MNVTMPRPILQGLLYTLLTAGIGSAAACGANDDATASAAKWERYDSREYGYSVRFPSGWHRVTEPLSPELSSPREIFSVGSIPLRYRQSNCEAWAGSAQQQLGPTDVFVTVREIGVGSRPVRDAMPRPARFGDGSQLPSERSACPGSEALIQHFRFRDARRRFDVLVASGPGASERTRRSAFAILDSLKLDPDVRPDWSSVG
jgi:hypothetical protein